jgi:predicted GNAT family acetyltransferase
MENLERMIKLAEEFFKTKNDPDQISINKRSMARLGRIHPSTMTERKNKKGPIAWMLVIPTTHNLMNKFVAKEITEQQLLYKTPLRTTYDALYLCSALVLPEQRGKGFAKRLAMKTVKSIKRQHRIKYLFYWAFSVEGKRLAKSIAKACDLPLYARKG